MFSSATKTDKCSGEDAKMSFGGGDTIPPPRCLTCRNVHEIKNDYIISHVETFQNNFAYTCSGNVGNGKRWYAACYKISNSGVNQIKTIAWFNLLQSASLEITASNKLFLEKKSAKPGGKRNEKPKSVKW